MGSKKEMTKNKRKTGKNMESLNRIDSKQLKCYMDGHQKNSIGKRKWYKSTGNIVYVIVIKPRNVCVNTVIQRCQNV